jgi:tungstate transport system substrate-binding protein
VFHHSRVLPVRRDAIPSEALQQSLGERRLPSPSALLLITLLLIDLTLVACSSANNTSHTTGTVAAPTVQTNTTPRAGVTATSQSTTPSTGAATAAATRATTPAAAFVIETPPPGGNKTILLATTTSTQDSGLLDVLIPLFQQQTGYQVKTQAVGSGAALQLGVMGEADVLLVHSPAAELDFMTKSQGVNRRLVMHNDFIIVAPPADPAHIKGMTSALVAMKAIATTRTPFISRGDNSGTNALELQLWQQAGISPKGQSWYVETGTGMGDTLNVTAEKNAYTISDRATYLATQKQTQLAVLVEKDPVLLNIYHVIQVNPANHTGLNVAGAQAFANWMVSPGTQAVVATFGQDKYGQALFVPDAGKSDAEVAGPAPTPTPTR